jgi:membrane-associated phospholipid phosphatase
MAVPHARLVTSLLVLGLIHLLPGRSVAQTVDQNLTSHTSPALCAGLFKGSLTLPDEADAREPLNPRNPPNNDLLAPSGAGQAAASTPEQPAHTGFSALFRAIGSDFKAFPQRKSTWVILAIGGAAAAAVHPADDDINRELQESKTLKNAFKPGKYLGSTYVQVGTAVGAYLIGRHARPGGSQTNKWSHIGFDLLRAQILDSALTYGIKFAVRRDRPTGECCSFPSGHASVTFATASVLERHFGYRGSWPMWVIASYVAASRLIDNRHFASDVVFGAAVGVASGWTVVGRHGRDTFAMVPVPMRRGMAVAFTWQPASARHGD